MNSPSATLSVLLAEEGLAVGEDTDAGELDAASAREYLFDPQHAISLLAQSRHGCTPSSSARRPPRERPR